jgi:hypothetical protein
MGFFYFGLFGFGLVFGDRFSLYSPGYSQICDLPAPTSHVLDLQTYATMPVLLLNIPMAFNS